jgi:S-adenosyl methyltransferase
MFTHMSEADRPAWAPDEIDWRKPSAARVYDVHLGGGHNFEVDRQAAAEIARVMPELPELFRANRSFLRRAVRFLVAQGIDQFLDLGSGIPTVGNVHEVAQRDNPDARVAYVDIDPVAAAHSRNILAGNPTAITLRGDLREPAQVLADPLLRGLLDLDRPVGVLLVAALNFVADDADPARIVAEYLKAVPSGSYLAISHPVHSELDGGRSANAAALYSRSVDSLFVRERPQIESWFTGLELVEPGLVHINEWRPHVPEDAQDATRFPQLGAVARKP